MASAFDLMESLAGVKFTTGKHNGHTFAQVKIQDPEYSKWLACRERTPLSGAFRLYLVYLAMDDRVRVVERDLGVARASG